MTSLTELRFFTTPAHDCSYLPNRKAITLFVDPLAEVDTGLYTSLSAVGFRRSGNHIYRPYCQSCSACIPVRLPVADFHPNRSQRRTLKRNADVTCERLPPVLTEEYFRLYEAYINARHADGDMYPASREQFESFLVDGRPEAWFYEYRVKEQLIAVSVVDQLDDGLSAIYTFFDPDLERRALGVFGVLRLVEAARDLGLSYLYLGYWIKQCQKMSYKTDYKPVQMFINNHWVPVES